MDYEESRRLLSEYAMSGALGNIRYVLLELLTEVERLREMIDNHRSESDVFSTGDKRNV